ncbi:pentapeptide repeat-containing protein [Amycolatopsis kentuckyensis]|uniref:pentapeptide repeat-containing protein n=1 Tax=Amycolatopsis kentuckyensis TaxID=218823 RepID=UPI0035648E48
MKRVSPLLLAFVLSVAAFAGVLVWLLADRATSRGDALKTAGLAGGAVAALYGLWLNDRRRRVEEDRHELERTRISDERFAKSVELLGHEADQVRVGAIHALGGLARSELYTQTVIDVLCAYLRRPFAHPEFDDAVDDPAIAERELLVRRTAQRVIRASLPDAGSAGPAYTLDLSGARLDRFNLSGKHVGLLGAQAAAIVNGASFVDTTFAGSVFLTGASVHGPVDFTRTRFGAGTGFRDFTVHDEVRFEGVFFALPPDFGQARLPAGAELP